MAHALQQAVMAKTRPGLRSTETYTEQNFLRLQITPGESGADSLVTLEHFFCEGSTWAASSDSTSASTSAWRSVTIVDAETMSRRDALLIARSYATQHAVPVIYECRPD